jgi:hypothetical protein
MLGHTKDFRVNDTDHQPQPPQPEPQPAPTQPNKPTAPAPPATPSPQPKARKRTSPAVIIGIMLVGAAIAAALWMLTKILVPTGPVVNFDHRPYAPPPRPPAMQPPPEQPPRPGPAAQSLPTSGPVLSTPHIQRIAAGRSLVRMLHQPPTAANRPAAPTQPAQAEEAWRLCPIKLAAAAEIAAAKLVGSNGYPSAIAQSGPDTQLLVLTVQAVPAKPIFAIDLTGLTLLEPSGAVHRPVGLALSPAAPLATPSAASPAPAPATAAAAPAEATTSASPARPARLPEFRDFAIGLGLHVQDGKLGSSPLQDLGPGMVGIWATAGWDKPIKLDLLFDVSLPARQLVLSSTAGL